MINFGDYKVCSDALIAMDCVSTFLNLDMEEGRHLCLALQGHYRATISLVLLARASSFPLLQSHGAAVQLS